ncbi:MAG: trypsin-like peptidase domain-containing protein [Candidatus Omnitrophica bacterium]|nr:trypsin-like peptidase domain-containing protein [Candidatus Omnitrophota bacterium]
MKNGRLLSLILLFSLCFSSLVFAETIVLKSGKTVEGKIVERTDKYIKVDFYGVQVPYFLNDIKSIDGNSISKAKESLSQNSPRDIFESISPAVVYITNKTLAGEEYLGSGFVVDPKGIVVTNFHVTKLSKEINVKFKNGKSYPVTGIIYYDARFDICIFKIEADDLPTILLGNSDSAYIGDKIYVIGNPLGLEYTFSDGLLSGVREYNKLKYLQFSAPISPGNSGGPLINSKGEVLGIVTFLMQGGQNLNFALAINTIKPLITTTSKMSIQQFVETVSRADYYYSEAERCMFRDDFKQSVELLKKVIEINPKNVDVYNTLGLLSVYLDQLLQAKDYYEKAMQINPTDPAVYANLGDLYLRLDDSEKGITYLKKSLDLMPNAVDLMVMLGNGLVNIGKKQQGIEYFEKALQLNPDYINALLSLSLVYADTDFEKSTSYLKKATEINPEDPGIYRIIGTLDKITGDIVSAKEAYKKSKMLYLQSGFILKAKTVEDDLRALH